MTLSRCKRCGNRADYMGNRRERYHYLICGNTDCGRFVTGRTVSEVKRRWNGRNTK